MAGGAIMAVVISEEFALNNIVFSSNIAKDQGGALSLNAIEKASFSSLKFSENTAEF